MMDTLIDSEKCRSWSYYQKLDVNWHQADMLGILYKSSVLSREEEVAGEGSDSDGFIIGEALDHIFYRWGRCVR